MPTAAFDWLAVPVTLPPGRARLPTRPEATGSAAPTTTMGIVVVASFAASADADTMATITSGLFFTISAASAGSRAKSPSAERRSTTIVLPSTYPKSRIPDQNAASRGFGPGVR